MQFRRDHLAMPPHQDKNVAVSIFPAAGMKGTQSLDRALQLLALVAEHQDAGISSASLVEQTDLDRTTVHRLLKALERHQLLYKESKAEGYRLGLQAYALGQSSMIRHPLVRHLAGKMKSLARKIDEPLFLVARAGDYSHCLHLEPGTRPVKSFYETVGNMRLLGLGVPSFALLSHMSDGDILSHFGRYEGEYIKNRMTLARLRKWVQEGRQLGFSNISGNGVRGVGVRFIFASCGEAALGFVAPSTRMSKNAAIEMGHLLCSEVKTCIG